MSSSIFSLTGFAGIPVSGEQGVIPVRRIFCVGRNYAAHAVEMGNEVDRVAPFYFTKSPEHAVRSGATIPYPAGTNDYHHEIELTVALDREVSGLSTADASNAVFGYGVALDMTRRDRQAEAKGKARPWDLAKDFENSAVFAPLTRRDRWSPTKDKRIYLDVNGHRRQDATLSEMIHNVPEIIGHLSGFYHLGPGDIILTGTPAGVGAVVPGDVITGGIDGLDDIELTIADQVPQLG